MEKRAWIEPDHPALSIHRQCELLGVSRSNLDFTTIPYWGDATHLEQNWSGKRHHSLASMLAVLAQNPDSGLIDYGDTTVLHKNEHAVILEFLDFYREGQPDDATLKYLVFDSKFSNYENLRKLDEQHINFVTIRRRGKKIIDHITNLPPSHRKKSGWCVQETRHEPYLELAKSK